MKHPPIVRVTHWLNAVAIIVMIGSGWRIYNSSPIWPFAFPVAVTIGGDVSVSQAAHDESGLANALYWHFAGMWLLVFNFIVYLAHGFRSGHFRKDFLPLDPKAFVREVIAALRLRLDHDLSHYNAVQKALYVGVLLAILTVILSGLSIWKPVQFHELTWLFGGFDIARIVHFLCMTAIVLFLLVHVALALLVPKTLVGMTVGRTTAQKTDGATLELAGDDR